MTDYIKVDELKDGYLYRITASRADYGIWLKDHRAFLISGVKFGPVYLFEEIHCGLDNTCGAVKPIEEIEIAPFPVARLNKWTQDDGDILEYIAGKNNMVPLHLDNTS